MVERIIKVKTCDACPYIHKDSGMGHCASFVICNKYNILLSDKGGPENFDYKNKIHPDCKLEKERK